MRTYIVEKSKLGKNVKIWNNSIVFNSEIGDDTQLGSFVEIGNAKIGKRCRIGSFAFICDGIEIGDDVFIGPHVCFTNDKTPSAQKAMYKGGFVPLCTKVEDNATIGANATILPGITIGKGAFIGAGSVVTKNVPAGEIWFGNPARKQK
jgi:acetyltransferase-like isoleucine patch superfamily enzyme